ncbi:uncharacterized protein LOC126743338 [Anthonomus grandis grandis]|uniref:uncharacterized protein LOC126743338 n=1 Tax=Anthonomus grandis grandis TaxID=2921223 RepID=UPI0021660EF1|nr:uncharacterized protein LOC126743338 [Anthonomus grandis grandis]
MISIGQFVFAIIIAVLSFVAFYAQKLYRARKLLTKWLPQGPGYPIIGSVMEFGPSTEILNNFTRLTNNPKKSVYLEAFHEWLIVTRDYDLLEFIMSSHEHITKGSDYDHLVPWLGNGLLLTDGKKWRSHRRIITPTFHFSILEQFVEIFNSNEDIFIERLKKEAVGKKGIEIYSLILDCALDIICETAMGVKMGAQQKNNQEYTEAVRGMCEIFTTRNASLWQGFEFLFRFSKDYKRQQKCLKVLHDFTNNVIERRKQELEKKHSETTEEATDELGRKRRKAFLDLLLESKDENGQPFSQEDIREEVDTFMFAGHDTTSSAIASGLMILSNRPDIQNTIRDELKAIFGKNKDRPMTYQDIHDMSYLELVAKEILRTCPPAPIISRKLQKDAEFKGNIIPKDTTISMMIYGINHDPDFHEDPERFNPDRFLEQNKRKPYSFVPFSAGPRNCIGQKYAMLELKSMLAKMIMNFEILPSEIPHKPEFAIEVVYKSKNGVYIKLQPIEWIYFTRIAFIEIAIQFFYLLTNMIIVIQIIIGIITVALSYMLYQARKVYKARKLLTNWIPQVPGSLYFGAKTEFGPTTERLKDFDRLLNNPEKSVYLEFLNNWVILTRNYDLMEFILSSNEFITKGKNYKNIVAWLGYAILIANGKKWKTRRRIITPTFHFSILEQFVDVFNSNEDIMIEKLRREAVGKKGVEIYSYVTNCALDIICETAMGVKMDSQLNKNKEYTDAVKEMCELVALRTISFWKNWDWLFYFSSDYKRQQKILKILHGFTNSVIEKRKKELESKKSIKREEVDSFGRKRKKALLDLLLESTDNGLTEDDIREEVDTFMFAGHDTTSSAVTSGLLLLSKRPDIQKLVRDELKGIFGKDRDRPLTYKDLQNMSYLELVAKEILRVNSPVPFIARRLTKDVIYKDHIIPRDTVITMYLYGMNRDPDYHKDPEKFDPDRFLSTDKKAYSFVPFSAGPRNCIGQKYAMLELKSMLAKILMNFEVLPSEIPHNPEFAVEIVLKSKNGVYIKLKEVD